MSDKVIVSKQDANDLPYVEQEHSGDKYVLLEDIKHWLDQATPVSEEAVAIYTESYGLRILSNLKNNTKLYTTPQPAPQIKDFDVAYTCKRIRRLLKLLNIPDPSPDNDEVLLGCLFSLLGTACGIIERQQPAPDTVPREQYDKLVFALKHVKPSARSVDPNAWDTIEKALAEAKGE